MQTITIDIINKKAMKLFAGCRVAATHSPAPGRKAPSRKPAIIDWASKYKGAMTKQRPADIDHQLNELRNEWE